MTILLIVLAYMLYTYIFVILLNISLIVNIIIASLFGLISLGAIYIVIASNKPVISFKEDYFWYRYKKILFSNIQSFHIARGGSEPYIITKEGNRIDLELSWLKKQDRKEIEETIQSQVSNE